MLGNEILASKYALFDRVLSLFELKFDRELELYRLSKLNSFGDLYRPAADNDQKSSKSLHSWKTGSFFCSLTLSQL